MIYVIGFKNVPFKEAIPRDRKFRHVQTVLKLMTNRKPPAYVFKVESADLLSTGHFLDGIDD